MKSISKTLLAAALAGVLFGVLLRNFASKPQRELGDRSPPRKVPTVNPLSDAEPQVEEPLQESELRVAQNAPF